MRAREFRMLAADKCKPYSGKLALSWLVYGIIMGASNFFAFLIVGPMMLGYTTLTFDVLEDKDVVLERMFDGFKDFLRSFLISLLTGIFVAIGSFFFVIPGIIISYRLTMALHVAHDNKDLTAMQCLKRSKQIMKGNKWRLFCLELSYIGWIILSAFTFGILLFWVGPKMQVAKTAFYKEITQVPEPIEQPSNEQEYVY